MQIIFSANNNEEIIYIPYVPPGININEPQNNEEFKTINSGTLNLIGDMGLKSLDLATFFPVKRYHWLRPEATLGWECVAFFEKWRKAKVPIRVVAMEDDFTMVNMPCTIDTFTFSIKRNKDINYRLSAKEYPFVSEVKR